MNTFLRFFYEFISIFFDGVVKIFNGLIEGFKQMFKFSEYTKVISNYNASLTGIEKVFMYISVFVIVAILFLLIFLIIMHIRKLFRRMGNTFNKEELLEEITNLNEQVAKLMKEKDEIMAMKVSQLGVNPDDDNNIDPETGEPTEDEEEIDTETTIRFPKLAMIDAELGKTKVKNYNNSFTLAELIDNFRCFAASQLKLYYDFDILRPFFAGLACGKIIILQGISGTGKTSLAYAWGKFVKQDSCVSAVEPSWKDKSDFLGYFNEFTKKFNETRALGEIYAASFDDDVHTIILDEMNLARVEYYFADLLSLLEMPNRDEWLVDIVSSSWGSDPKRLVNGKLKLPGNIWYIGTINNDDSTFMVTDKVYDRAMPLDINSKVAAFKCREQEAMDVNSSYLEQLFVDAREQFPLTDEGLKQVVEIDDYVVEHFRIAFGNRIMKQLNVFVPVYVACGGKEIAAIDYFIARKILRKFDQLSVVLIKNEVDPFINFLNKKFGKGVMKECIAYLENLKKTV